MIHISVHPLQRGNKCFYKDVIEFCQSVWHTKQNQHYQLEEYAVALQWPVLTSKFIRFVFTKDFPDNCSMYFYKTTKTDCISFFRSYVSIQLSVYKDHLGHRTGMGPSFRLSEPVINVRLSETKVQKPVVKSYRNRFWMKRLNGPFVPTFHCLSSFVPLSNF